MIFNSLPHFPIFSLTIISRILITISSNNWLFIWAGIELNLLSFIPLAIYWNNNYETEGIVKYFLVQSIASGLLLISIIINYIINIISLSIINVILISTLLLKLGIAPYHFWFPQVINRISWFSVIMLSTIQKINPLLIILYISFLSNKIFIISLVLINRIIAGLGGINQTQIKPLIAYSSIGHIIWILTGCLSSFYLSFLYFIFYLIISYSLIHTFIKFKTFTINQFNNIYNLSFSLNIILFLNLLSLAGLPPLLGFLPKWIVLDSIFALFPIISSILILGSLLTLFYYLSIFFSSFISLSKSLKISTDLYKNSWFYVLSLSPLFITIIFI